jgi:ferrous iron transport protein A
MKRLSEIKPGQSAKITSFASEEMFLKLMEMGCIPGEIVTVVQIAPLKDPISIKVAGYQLSLRLNEAEQVIVEEC